MACLRNLVIGVLSRAGPVNLAASPRHHARGPVRPLTTLGLLGTASAHVPGIEGYLGYMPPSSEMTWLVR
jgi:hypothetical protein